MPTSRRPRSRQADLFPRSTRTTIEIAGSCRSPRRSTGRIGAAAPLPQQPPPAPRTVQSETERREPRPNAARWPEPRIRCARGNPMAARGTDDRARAARDTYDHLRPNLRMRRRGREPHGRRSIGDRIAAILDGHASSFVHGSQGLIHRLKNTSSGCTMSPSGNRWLRCDLASLFLVGGRRERRRDAIAAGAREHPGRILGRQRADLVERA